MKVIVAIFISLLVAASTLAQGQPGVATLPIEYGGAYIFRTIDLDEAPVAILQSGQPQKRANMYGWHLFNAAASTRYFKFYNALVANVTVGTTTPVMTIPIPAGAGANVYFANGVEFRTAITAACTTGVADSNTGAPGANECIMNLFWK